LLAPEERRISDALGVPPLQGKGWGEECLMPHGRRTID
jgi:hypothetical protein